MHGQSIDWKEVEYQNAKVSIDLVATIKNTLTEPCYVMISQEAYVKKTQMNEAITRKLASRFGTNKLSMFLDNSTKRAEEDSINSVPEAFIKKLNPKESFELVISTTRSQSTEAQQEMMRRLIVAPASVLSPLAPNFDEAMTANQFFYEENKLSLFWGDLSVRFRSSRYGMEDFYEWQRRLRVPLLAQTEVTDLSIVPSTDCDVPPRFPDGDEELFEYLSEQMKGEKVYTNEQGMPGRVVLTFVVELDGSITDIRDQKSSSGDLTKIATRIVKEMPEWTPARWRGKEVRSRYTLPITCVER